MSRQSDYTQVAPVAADDKVNLVDISDTSMSADGSTKWALVADTAANAPGPTAADCGYIAWTGDPWGAAGGAGALVAGKLMLARFWVRKQATVSTVGYAVNTQGVTLTASQNFIGIYSSAGTLMGQSADQSAVWVTAGSYPTAITSPFTAPVGSYWVAFLSNGTTPPVMRGSTAPATFLQFNQTAANSRVGIYGSAQTTLPGSITPASIVQTAANAYTAVIF